MGTCVRVIIGHEAEQNVTVSLPRQPDRHRMAGDVTLACGDGLHTLHEILRSPPVYCHPKRICAFNYYAVCLRNMD